MFKKPIISNKTNKINNIKKPIIVKTSIYPTNIKELLYITSAIIGVVCTIDSYFYSGKELNCQRYKQYELVQELNKKDDLIFNLILTLNSKIDNNQEIINKIGKNLILLESKNSDMNK